MRAQINKVTIDLVQQDILTLEVEGIVNQTDTALNLPPAFLVKVGSTVADECRRIGRCDVGSAVVTSGGKLNFQKIIHTVGPRWGEGSERGKLASAVWECLRLAEAHHLKSLAIPALSTGTHGYPLENCAKTMLSQLIDFTFEHLKSLRTLIVSLDNDVALEVFQREFDEQLQQLRQTGEGKVRV
ncbi:MAG: macro domain-containing protein [Chloroflexi bacterium]|nr:macro domain-containing protein [Chloroflexota bacterium]